MSAQIEWTFRRCLRGGLVGIVALPLLTWLLSLLPSGDDGSTAEELPPLAPHMLEGVGGIAWVVLTGFIIGFTFTLLWHLPNLIYAHRRDAWAAKHLAPADDDAAASRR